MSIGREYGKCFMVCDECEDTSEADEDFMYMIQQAKRDGWLTIKADEDDDDSWTNLCPDCSERLPRV